MARAKTQENGNGRVDRLEQIVAKQSDNIQMLIQTQASFNQQMAVFTAQQAQTQTAFNQQMAAFTAQQAQTQTAFNQQLAAFTAQQADTSARMAEYERRTDERCKSIEKMSQEHSDILRELVRVITALPDAMREKMGFRPTPKPGENP